jgi:hypothetical protein
MVLMGRARGLGSVVYVKGGGGERGTALSLGSVVYVKGGIDGVREPASAVGPRR